MEHIGVFQWILGALTLAAALNVIIAKNPVVSAMSLMATLFTTGALYFGLGFFFIGAVQILIYAGAISVLFVFIVMLLDLKPTQVRIPGIAGASLLKSVGAVTLMIALILPILKMSGVGEGGTGESATSAAAASVALRFLSKYMLPFQVTGLLIFAAVIGAILIGRPRHQVKETADG